MIRKAVRRGLPRLFVTGLFAAAAVLIPTGNALAAVTQCNAYPPCQIYTTDVFGGVHEDGGSPKITNQPTFVKPVERASHMGPGTPATGLVMDAFGGLHPYGSPAMTPSNFPYYPGMDIARDFVFASTTGGYELDGYGGIHPFTVNSGAMPAAPVNYSYFKGNDVARKITLLASGNSGYVLDNRGGIHPWAAAGGTLPVAPAQYGYWPGANVARDIWVDPASTPAAASGFVIDLYGGFHAFWGGTSVAPLPIVNYPYWKGRDLARAFWFSPGSSSAASAGYVLDAFGGIHPFAGQGQALPPPIFPFAYWNGQDLARNLFGG